MQWAVQICGACLLVGVPACAPLVCVQSDDGGCSMCVRATAFITVLRSVGERPVCWARVGNVEWRIRSPDRNLRNLDWRTFPVHVHVLSMSCPCAAHAATGVWVAARCLRCVSVQSMPGARYLE